LKKFWQTVSKHLQDCRNEKLEAINVDKLNDDQKALRKQTHTSIKKVGDDIERRNTFNTAISSIRELSNAIAKFKLNNDSKMQDLAVTREAISAALILLHPFTPHYSEHLLSQLGEQIKSWPEFDESTQTKNKQEIVIQVNGKLRAKIATDVDISKQELESLALKNEGAIKFLEGITVRKVIVVPGKLVNIVAN
jgi:leucyl-tRNA synthetase